MKPGPSGSAADPTPADSGKRAGVWPALHWYCLGAWLTLAVYLADLYRLDPDRNLAGYMAEGGPFQNLQLMLLGWALLLCLWGAWRLEHTIRRVTFFWLGPLFYLFWREADWDKDVFSAWFGLERGVRMFSWRYLWNGGELPWLLRVIWGAVSLGMVAVWAYGCWRARAVWPLFLRMLRSPPVVFWLGLTLFILIAAQAVERLGLAPASVPGVRDPYSEEAPELLGEFALLCSVIHFIEQARALPRANEASIA